MSDSPRTRSGAPRVYLVTANLAPFDAIGNDVIGMRAALLQAGYAVETFAADVHPSLSGLASRLDLDTQTFWEDRDSLLIYHHSMGWPAGQNLIEAARNRIAVKYHNITPPRFFQPYSDTYTGACRAGEVANFRVANHRRALFWGDSTFNCDDLARYGAPPVRCRVLAPFHFTEDARLTPPDKRTAAALARIPGPKVLFVGGIKPNKGHLQLLRTIAEYKRRFDSAITLILPGSLDSRLRAYMSHLEDAIQTHGLESNVLFPGPVNASQLNAYFLLSDVLLCQSEHEGFCVPLVEAMYHRLPIVACSSTAIPETVGEAGMVWSSDAAALYAESLAAILDQPGLAETLRRRGRRRFDACFSRPVLGAGLGSLVEEAFRQAPA